VVLIPSETGKNIQVGHLRFIPEPWLKPGFFAGRARRLMTEIRELNGSYGIDTYFTLFSASIGAIFLKE
jgi:hypothetical protein